MAGSGPGTKATAVPASSITLSYLVEEIDGIIQDSAFDAVKITKRLNLMQSRIAGGIKMPDGSMSPSLPDLYKYGTVTTLTTAAYVSLPSDYQRNAFKILDSSGNKIAPPRGGDYYAFNLFLKQVYDLTLSAVGAITKVAIKGRKLYYQGIPATAETLGIHYYRKPTDMALGDDCPDGIPTEDLQYRLLVHGVCADIFGVAIEDGQDNTAIGTKYHKGEFYNAMQELCEIVGIDAEPQFYGEDDEIDAGACD